MVGAAQLIEVFRLSRRRYDSNADYRAMQRRVAELSVHELFLREVALGDLRTLEIGSYAGGYSEILATHSKAFIASDIVRHPELPLELNFQTLDATKVFPFPENSFDFIYCSSVVEHLSDATRLLPESARILRPGGRMLLSYPPFYSLFLVGGHKFKPWHLLGRSVGLRARQFMTGLPTMSYEQAGLYPLRVSDVEKLICMSPLRTLDKWTRFSPVNFMRLPNPFPDLLSWHSCWLLGLPN